MNQLYCMGQLISTIICIEIYIWDDQIHFIFPNTSSELSYAKFRGMIELTAENMGSMKLAISSDHLINQLIICYEIKTFDINSGSTDITQKSLKPFLKISVNKTFKRLPLFSNLFSSKTSYKFTSHIETSQWICLAN